MKPDEKDNARGRGPRRGPDDRHRQSDPPPAAPTEVEGWLAGRLPAQWFTAAADVVIDRDEITVIGRLSLDDIPAGVDSAAAEAGRIKRFREETRDARIAIAQEAEARYGRSIAWGAAAGESQQLFANLAVPAMTRLRQPERLVLDTLVDAGVARSRAEALAWCVRLVGRHEEEWITALRTALNSVEQVRSSGPLS
ncbi:MAG: hypothetical protein NTZ03_15780 [Actinobacteria bacterium]|nr:hypothetical protein [Actinomycetota bacterium]